MLPLSPSGSNPLAQMLSLNLRGGDAVTDRCRTRPWFFPFGLRGREFFGGIQRLTQPILQPHRGFGSHLRDEQESPHRPPVKSIGWVWGCFEKPHELVRRRPDQKPFLDGPAGHPAPDQKAGPAERPPGVETLFFPQDPMDPTCRSFIVNRGPPSIYRVRGGLAAKRGRNRSRHSRTVVFPSQTGDSSCSMMPLISSQLRQRGA